MTGSLIHHNCSSPLGEIRIVARDQAIVGIFLPNPGSAPPPSSRADSDDPILRKAATQLEEYFAGRRRTFDLPFAAEGTSFQQSVWTALVTIPFGETRSYGELAALLGRPSASRAVGAANGKNPLAIVVPCHRVIGGDGSLTGYAGGLANKKWLLEHEARVAGRLPTQQSLLESC